MTCANCGKPFQPRRRNQTYCRRECRESAKRDRWAVIRVSRSDLNTLLRLAGRLLRRPASALGDANK